MAADRASAPRDRKQDRERLLADLRRRVDAVAPTGPAASSMPTGSPERAGGTLAVSGPLAEVLPRGGLPRGGVVSIVDAGVGDAGVFDVGTGDAGGGRATAGGATSLLLGLLAGPDSGWSAVVGLPELGLLAAAELGVDLNRIGVIPDPGADVLQVLSVLTDGVDLIAVGEPRAGWGPQGRRRVLAGRLRQHGTVLLVAGRWPGADLRLTARHTGWVGIGRGHGRLRDRELTITVSGRRMSGRNSEHVVLLSGRRNGTVAVTGRDSAGHWATAAGW